MEVSVFENYLNFTRDYEVRWKCSGEKLVLRYSISQEVMQEDTYHQIIVMLMGRLYASAVKTVVDRHNTDFCDECYESLLKLKGYVNDIGVEVDTFSLGLASGQANQVAENLIDATVKLNSAPPKPPLSRMARLLPGVNTLVKYPCDGDCNLSGWSEDLDVVIIHLNDRHKWPREQIADWLDSIDDPENGVDLAFKVPEKEES